MPLNIPHAFAQSSDSAAVKAGSTVVALLIFDCDEFVASIAVPSTGRRSFVTSD